VARPLPPTGPVHLAALIANNLSAIKLSPRTSCRALERVWLHNNRLERLGLRPLASAKNLRSLHLDGNRLHDATLDLAPLAFCTLLRALRLARSGLDGVLDITPVLACAALITLDVSVKLTALARPADGAGYAFGTPPLPPLPLALRRRAATVHWNVEEDEVDVSDDEAGEDTFLPTTMPRNDNDDGLAVAPLQSSPSLNNVAAL
jgi:hypothetical protein